VRIDSAGAFKILPADFSLLSSIDHGLPIDPAGELDGTNVADARGLSIAMSSSTKVAQCLVHNYYACASGHVARPVDASVLNELSKSFQASGYKLRDLVVDTFTHRALCVVAPQL